MSQGRKAFLVSAVCVLALGTFGSAPAAEERTVAETESYYLHSLSGMGGARKMVMTQDGKTVVVFYVRGGAQLVYATSSDLGNTWLPEKPVVIGSSLAGGTAAWIDERDDIYLVYPNERNTFCFRKLTCKGDAQWEVGEPGNGGRSLGVLRAYYHSGICKEPGGDGRIWACWWEHGKEGDKTGTVRRLRVAHSTDPDGREPWSEPVDPVPADVPINENEGNTVTMLLVDRRPAVFVYQPATWGFRSGLCVWNGKDWSWNEVDTKPTPKTTVFPQANYAVTADAAGTVHFVWNAQAETGSVFYRKFGQGRWSEIEVLSRCPYDRFPTITVNAKGEVVAIWCHPVKDEVLKDTKAPEPRANYNIVYRKCAGGKWDTEEKTVVRDEQMQEGVTNHHPNTCLVSGDVVLFTYQYARTESGGGKRTLKSATIR